MNDTIYSINGPVVTLRGARGFSMMEMVYVGEVGLIGEVIGITSEKTTIQVYEDTAGLKVGEPVRGTGAPLCATLGPGIMQNIFDGIERPLATIAQEHGAFIASGVHVASLDEHKLWDVTVLVKPGQQVTGGSFIASCPETSIITHKSMVPPDVSGTVTWAAENGQYTIQDPICKVKTPRGEERTLYLAQKWPIRTPRPVALREAISRPLVTGQRVIDSLFPIAKGGAAAVPGGFGTGKTMTQHQLAKWCDADIIVYVGCGERGNEMTQVLNEFSELEDPKSGKPMTERTTLIANTSNMPVAAREASIYTGVTLAEYYRDMGYDVAMMADSTSRWAEALREISGRLEEMPAEEGFPAYLPSRLAAFYERAGCVKSLNGEKGSVSIIGAVSPQGSDFSEPVTQNTKRFVRCFLALDKSLAYARHYPAINWTLSYSEYYEDLDPYYTANLGEEFCALRGRMLGLLSEENKLMEIVKLIGSDVLPDSQKVTLETARVIRVGFLQQNAFHQNDTYVPLEKQLWMMRAILHLYDKASALSAGGVPVSDGPLVALDGVSGVGFEEMVRIQTAAGPRAGRVVALEGERAVVQVFAGTSGMDLSHASTRFSGHPMRLALADEIVGRIFNGAGEPVDGLGPVYADHYADINGSAINPVSRAYPRNYIRTGISSIDTLITLIRGQKLPIFSGSGMSHNQLAAQIVRQAQLSEDSTESVGVVFCALGVTKDVAEYFRKSFEESGALSRVTMFLNLSSDPIIERILTPRCALTAAEYLAFEKGMHILVVMTDMTSYAEALREFSSSKGEIPGRKGYPGYLYSDFASLYERAGVIAGRSGSVTQIPILTMPNDDITHPIPVLTGYITEGQIVLDRYLDQQGIYPPISVLPSLSRLMKDGIGEGYTRKDHPDVSNQLFASYAKVSDARGLASVIGEEELSPTDKLYLDFGNHFEKEFLGQGQNENRTISESLDLGWRLLSILPREELDRLDEKVLDEHYRAH